MGLVAEGGDAIRKATEDAEAWGLALNRVDAVKLEMANDALTRAKAAAQGAFTTIAVNLAPAIKLLGDRFADTAAEAGGFRDEISSGMSQASEAVAGGIWFVERMQFAWAALKFGAAAAVNGIIWALESLDRVFTDVMNSLAASWVGKQLGMEARQYSATLEEVANWSISNLLRLEKEIENLALSSRSLDEWRETARTAFKAAADEMQAEAERIAEARRKMMGGGEAGIEKPQEKPVKEDEWAKQVAQRMERLAFENETELDQLQIQLQAKSDLIDAARALGLLTEEEHQQQLFIITDKYAKAKAEVEEKYRQLNINRVRGALGAAAGLMQSHSRAAFNVGKAAAISLAVMDTYASAVGVYQSASHIPYVGWILAPIAAAGAIVAGMANVAKIRSTQFGGGDAASPVFSASPVTGIPTGSPGTQEFAASPPSLPQAAAAPTRVDITLIGDRGTQLTYGEMVDKFIPLLKEAGANGAIDLNVSFA
jgi:hypothetical protein